MAKNDIVLLDRFIEKAQAQFGISSDESELFELFAFDQLLKQYEPSIDELESGWTDGGNDGGIDGLFVFVDGRSATPDSTEYALKRNPSLDVYIISARKSATFEQQPIDSLISSLGELFNLTLDEDRLSYPYNESVLQQRSLFKSVFVSLAERHPVLRINVIYCSRGNSNEVAPNIQARASILESTLMGLFSNAEIKIAFAGASELLTLCRKTVDFNIRLPFAEAPISREGKNYIILCPLRKYFEAICDETRELKRYLFESNVRDYLGNVQVNNDILSTLKRDDAPSQSDFWWLNNGVTVLATDARIIAKELLVENAQIVNGLQTTETLYKHYINEKRNDDRAILIKIIVTDDNELRGRIIKATNYQNAINLSYLRGLDRIQNDIEEFLLDYGWFYDRRHNQYKNQGKPADRIISIQYLAAAVRAIALGDPAGSPRQRARSLRDDKIYNAVFVPDWDIKVYLVCLEIVRAIDQSMRSRRSAWTAPPMALTHFIGFVYACECLGKFPYKPEEIVKLVGKYPTTERIATIQHQLAEASEDFSLRARRFKRVWLSKKFIEQYVKRKLGDGQPD